MDVELTLAGSVWNWARQCCPNEPRVAKRAVGVAMTSYAVGHRSPRHMRRPEPSL